MGPKQEDPKVYPETPLELKIAEYFAIFDHTGKQVVEVKEVTEMVRYMGCCPTNAEIEDIIARTQSKDTPEFVTLFRFLPFMVRAINEHRYYPASADELLAAFRYFDKDGRGYLTKERFAKLMLEEGEVFDPEDEFEEIKNLALDPVTDTIQYENYINQLTVVSFELYEIADEMEKERLRLEALKPKKRTLI